VDRFAADDQPQPVERGGDAEPQERALATLGAQRRRHGRGDAESQEQRPEHRADQLSRCTGHESL
jgi:hypothetical protein